MVDNKIKYNYAILTAFLIILAIFLALILSSLPFIYGMGVFFIIIFIILFVYNILYFKNTKIN